MSVLVKPLPLQTALDVVTNNTGVATMGNLDLFLQANDLKEWTADIEAGVNYILPDGLETNLNRLQSIKGDPVAEVINAEMVGDAQGFFDGLSDIWILSTGIWNDTATWKDSKFWID